MNTYIINNIEEAADMAAYRGNPGLKGELVKGETSHDADLIRRYIADRAAQVAVIDMVQAAYSAAAIEERHRPLPVSLNEIVNALAEREAAFGGLGPCGYAVIEEHAYRIVEALSAASDPAAMRVRVAQAAKSYALWAATDTDLSNDSIEWWICDQMRNDAGREVRALAHESSLPEIEVRGIVADALRRHNLARRMAALPPAMRNVAIRCQNPTVPVLLALMELMHPEDREGMDPIRATRRIYVCIEAQAKVQTRHKAVLAAVATSEEA